MNDNERAIVAAMAQLRKLQRDALAIQAKIHRLEQEEVEDGVLDGEVGDLVSMRRGRPGPDGYGPIPGDRDALGNKDGNSRRRKIGKLRRTKAPHKQW